MELNSAHTLTLHTMHLMGEQQGRRLPRIILGEMLVSVPESNVMLNNFLKIVLHPFRY